MRIFTFPYRRLRTGIQHLICLTNIKRKILDLDYSIHMRMSVRHDSAESMDHLMRTIVAKEKDFEATATVVMESTGHYHKILKRALDLHGIRFWLKPEQWLNWALMKWSLPI